MKSDTISSILDSLLSLTREQKIAWRLLAPSSSENKYLPEQIIFSSSHRKWEIKEEETGSINSRMIGCFYIGKNRKERDSYFFSMMINGKTILSYTTNELEEPFKLKALHDTVLHLHNSALTSFAYHVLNELKKETNAKPGESIEESEETKDE